MKNIPFSGLNVIAGILIGIGGVGMNTTDKMPDKLYYEVCLGIGLIIFVIYVVMKMLERRENKSN
ncbi:MAG: hypothetical protein ABI378_15900 [Chitinophagaceae bacterium]